MDKSAQMEDNKMHSNTIQSEPVEYTNTPQKGVISKTTSSYTQPSAAPPQKSLKQQMEIEYNPSIANEIKKLLSRIKDIILSMHLPYPLFTQNLTLNLTITPLNQ